MAGTSPITIGNGVARTIATGVTITGVMMTAVITTAVTGGNSSTLIDEVEIPLELLPPPNVEGRRHRRRLR